MALPGSLPKVTQYVKNLGKSVAYSTVDYFKDTMPETSDFLETNQELFKEITVAVKDYRRTLIAAERTIKKSKIWEAGTEMKKSIFDSIKTGKFYDKDREAYYETKAGGSLGSMDDDDFGGFNDFDIGGDDLSDEDRSATRVSNAIHDATVAQASIIAKSADYLAQTQKDSTKLLFTQNERLYNQVTNGMENMYNAMDNMMNFMKGPLTTHMQNSETFYRELTSRVDNISKTLTEIAEMQRNLYKREQKYMEKSQFSKVGAMPDIKEYAKQIKKNILNEVPELSMLLGNDMGEDSNMLLAWAANPLKVIPDTITKILIPKTIKTAVESIDKSLSGVFSSFIGKMNYAKDNDTSILGLIARVLGLKVNNKNTINSANYEKGPVPFDGITRKTIVEVIPGHLARIEAALVGREERVFDYETGKWVDVSKISKDWNRRQSWAIQSAFSGVDSDLRSEINKRKRGSDDDKKKAKELEDAAFKIMKKAFEDGKFYPYGVNRDYGEKLSPWEYYGINDKNTFQAIVELLIGRPDKLGKGVKPKKGVTSLPYEILQGKESWANTLFNMEQSGQSSSRVLFNNAYNYGTGVGAGTKGNGTGIRNIIADATDKYNKNIFFYLRGIYAELDAIRSGRSGGGKNRKTRNIRSNLSSDDILKGFESSLGTPSDTVAGSNEEAGYDDSIGWVSDIEELQDHNTAESEIARLQREGAKKDIKSLLRSDKISDRVKGLTYSFTKLLSAPGEAIAGVINLADARLYRLMFGNKPDFDPNDEEEDSFFNVMKKKFTEGFDNIFNKIDDTIDSIKTKLGVESFKELFEKIAVRLGLDKPINWIKDKVNKYWSPVKDKLREKAGNAWRGFKGSMGRTFGYNGGLLSYFNRPSTDWSNVPIANADRVMQPSSIQGAGAFNMGWSNDDALAFLKGTGVIPKAKGGRVPWTGLYTLSAGERVIPNAGRQRQMRDLANERAVASMYGFNFPHMATAQPIIDNQPKEGKIIPFPGAKQEQEKVRKIIDEAMGNEGKGIPNIIASGLLGSGFSLLTGMVGGPLLGAAVGSAIGIVQNSNTIQTMLFGKEITDENGNKSREGGLISKNLQDKFKKYFPDMKDWGLAGGVLGLFTPFGIVGGMAMGAMAGLVKNTDAFQDFIFGPKGEDGTRDDTKALISKKYREYLKKAAPSMLIGAAGAALLGPFGFLPNVVLGSAVGLGVQTEGFKKALFGEMGEDGKRHGGIIGALKDGFVTPIIQRGQLILKEAKRFAQKNIFDPLKRFIKPAAQMIKNGITGFFDHMKDFFTNTAKKIFFEPIQDWLEHRVFHGIFNVVSKLVKAPMSIAKGVVAAPFRLLGNIGDNIRAGQIAKGTANDMTAEERLEFRKTHRGRFVGRFFNPALSRDRQRSNDEFLAGLRKGGEKGIQQMQNIKKELNEFINIKNALGNKVSDAVQEAVKWLSDRLNSQYFEVTTFVGKTGGKVNDNAYDIIGYARVHRVNVLISQGKKEEVLNNISKWTEVMHKKCGASTTDNDIDGFIAGIVNNKEFNSLLDKVVSSMAQVKDTAGARNALLGKLQGVTGIKNLSDARKYMRNLDTEIDAAKADQEGKDPAEKAGDQISAVIAKKADYISGILIDILRASDPDAASKYNENGAASEGSNAAEASKELLSGRSWTKEDENYLREHYESDGVKACAEALHRSPGAIRARVSKLRKDSTWEKQDEETPSETKKKNRLSTWLNNTFKRKIIKNYKTFEDTGIDVDVYEDNTEEVVHNGKYRKALRKKKRLDKTKEEVNEGTKKSLKNRMKILFGNIKNWAGFISQKLKGGLLGLWANMNDSNTIIGKIFKGVKVLAFSALIISALGHFSDWWKKKDISGKISNFFTKLWNGDGTDKKPGLKNRLIWLWEGKDKNGGIKGFIKKLLPNWFEDGKVFGKDGWFETKIKNPVKKFFEDVAANGLGPTLKDRLSGLFSGVWDWFKTGFKQFKDNILVPIWNWLSPRLKTALELVIINAYQNRKNAAERIQLLNSGKAYNVETVTMKDAEGNDVEVDVATGEYDTSIRDENGNINKDHITAAMAAGFNGGLDSLKKIRKTNVKDPISGYTFSSSISEYGDERLEVYCHETSECISYTPSTGQAGYSSTMEEFEGGFKNSILSYDLIRYLKSLINGAKFKRRYSRTEESTIYNSYITGFGRIRDDEFRLAKVKDGDTKIYIYIYDKNDTPIISFKSMPIKNNLSGFVETFDRFLINPDDINDWPMSADYTVRKDYDNERIIPKSSRANSNSNGIGTSSSFNIYTLDDPVFNNPDYSYRVNGRRRSGKSHLYMNDPGLSKIKYGNSTIGEAGCGPIAATNMINNIAPGRMDAMTAAYYGSMYQTSDGGTTPEYFSDIFGKAGIQSSQTDSKSKILKSVKNGNPAVLLGKSSRDSGTPFGSNNHYINLMGIDRKGNAIVEDPDLPSSRNVYPISKVLNDTISGITTGYSRSGRKMVANDDNFGGSVGTTNSGNNTIKTISTGSSYYGGEDFESEYGGKETYHGFDFMDLYNGVYKLGSGGAIEGKMTGSSFGDSVSGSIVAEEGDADQSKLHYPKGNDDDVRRCGFDPAEFRKYKISGNSSGEAALWNSLVKSGLKDWAAAGVLSNWYSESGLRTTCIECDWATSKETFAKYGGYDMCNLRGGMNAWYPYMKSLWAQFGVSLAENAYKGNDGNWYPGIGLAGWTGPRSQRLIAFAIANKQAWDSAQCQVGFFRYEMDHNHPDVITWMNNCKDPTEAARIYYRNCEMPGGSQESENAHKGSAVRFYNKYHNGGSNAKGRNSIEGYARRSTDYSRSSSRINYASRTADSIIKSHGMSGTNGSYYSNGAYSGSYSGSARYSGSAGSTLMPAISYAGSGSYGGSLSTIIQLLSVIADNTDALNSLRENLAGRGANIDSKTLKAAAENAKKQSADSPIMAIFNGSGRDDSNASASQIVAAMELLAKA